MIYFDNAASTPVEPDVIKLMTELMQKNFGNPSSLHEYGRQSKVIIENSRKTIARLLNVTPSEIIFTSGGTEANNHVLWSCPYNLKIKHFVTSPLEHSAVLNTLRNISNHSDIKVSHINVTSGGNIDIKHLDKILDHSPASVVSLMHANNETGNLLPVKQVRKICDKHNAIFHSDTVQTIGKYNIDLSKPGFDFAIASAHKFHGPKGVGFLYINPEIKIKPLITGGMQERNLRAGTENVCSIAGMSLALELAMKNIEKNQQHIYGLKSRLIKRIKDELPQIEFYGDKKEGLYTLINLSLPPGENSEMLPLKLDIEGIAVSGGSACTSGSNKPSHVISSLGLDHERPSLRVSFSKFNTSKEINHFVDTLKKVYI